MFFTAIKEVPWKRRLNNYSDRFCTHTTLKFLPSIFRRKNVRVKYFALSGPVRRKLAYQQVEHWWYHGYVSTFCSFPYFMIYMICPEEVSVYEVLVSNQSEILDIEHLRIYRICTMNIMQKRAVCAINSLPYSAQTKIGFINMKLLNITDLYKLNTSI